MSVLREVIVVFSVVQLTPHSLLVLAQAAAHSHVASSYPAVHLFYTFGILEGYCNFSIHCIYIILPKQPAALEYIRERGDTLPDFLRRVVTECQAQVVVAVSWRPIDAAGVVLDARLNRAF